MKKMNFISPVPPHKKQEVYSWIIVSGALLVLLTTTFSILLFSRWYTYASLKTQRVNLIDNEHICINLVQTAHKKESDYTTLSKQLAKLRQYSSHPKNPMTLLTPSIKKIGKHALQAYTITPETVELLYASNSTIAAQNNVAKLKTIPELSALKLVSLQKQNDTVISTVRAHLKK